MALQLSPQSNAHSGTAYRPKSKIESRIISLRRAWTWSLLRIVVHEICSLPHRILVILRTPSLRSGPEISRGMLNDGSESFDQENKFQRACIENMAQLKNENHWAGYLDLQITAISFQHGAKWAHRNFCNRTRNGES